jgi:DNA-binding MarR family transcriptional regulator
MLKWQRVDMKANGTKEPVATAAPRISPPRISPPRISPPRISLGPLDQRLGYVLRRAQLAVFADFFKSFEAQDIKPAQYSVLTIIASNVGLTQTQVAETLGIKKPNFVTMIRNLEKRGFVKRSATLNDKRSNILSLTKLGQSLLQELETIAETQETKIRDHIGKSQYEALFEPLRKMGEIGGI